LAADLALMKRRGDGQPIAHPIPEHDFSLSSAEWEQAVFDAATHFDCVMSLGGGRWRHDHFATLPEAISAADTIKGPYGQTPFIVAVTTSGRHVTLDKKDWPRWLQRWGMNSR